MTDDDMIATGQLNDMVRGYVECALWAGQNWSLVNDEDPDADVNPTPWDDEYGVEDVSHAAMGQIRDMCRDFIAYVEENISPNALNEWVEYGETWERIGHDFYLARNGHGAGFWDRFWGDQPGTVLGDQLADAARTWGESDFYVGDDGKLEVDG